MNIYANNFDYLDSYLSEQITDLVDKNGITGCSVCVQLVKGFAHTKKGLEVFTSTYINTMLAGLQFGDMISDTVTVDTVATACVDTYLIMLLNDDEIVQVIEDETINLFDYTKQYIESLMNDEVQKNEYYTRMINESIDAVESRSDNIFLNSFINAFGAFYNH